MKIAMCPDKTTCQNEAMIEELQERIADLTAGFNATVDKLEAVTAERDALQQHNITLAALVADAEQREFNVTAERDALRSQVSTMRDSRDDLEEQYFGALIDVEVTP